MVIAVHYDTFGIIKKSSCEPLNLPVSYGNEKRTANNDQQYYG